jgi:hypothetical protein
MVGIGQVAITEIPGRGKGDRTCSGTIGTAKTNCEFVGDLTI